MDSSSPSKRRKILSTSVVDINAFNTPSLIPRHNSDSTTPGRASYLSPTKASLSRFNPGLLPQAAANGGTKKTARSSRNPTFGRPRSSKGESGRMNTIDSSSRPTTPGSHQDGDRDPKSKPARNEAQSVTPRRTTQAFGGGLSVAPRRLSRTPGRGSSATPVSITGPDAVIAASPPETAEEAPDMAQEVIDGQLEHELQGSARKAPTRKSQVRDRIEVPASAGQGEPELPPTPTQLGLEAPPEPPKGIWYSPSRRPLRKEAPGINSSPLKPRDPPDETPLRPQRRTSARIQGMMKQLEQQPEAKVIEISEEELHKQRVRDELRVHLQQLQGDVEVCEKEIERVRKPGDPLAPDEETIGKLTSILADEGAGLSKPSLPRPPPLSKILCGFLPFSRPITAHIPKPIPSILTDAHLPSHLPIDLEDPLPYLKVFTPLDFTSVSTLVSASADSHDLLQQHDISITAPQRLLDLKLNLTIDTSTHTVRDLVIHSLTPWAEAELGSWIREHATGDGPAGKDMSGVCWATSRYWELSAKRARCWARCYEQFPALLSEETVPAGESVDTNGVNVSSGERPVKRGRHHSRPQRDHASDPLNNDGEDEDEDGHVPNPDNFSRHTMLQHLGRRSLLFQHPSSKAISLLITWRIAFDWTGEAESHLQAVSAVPESWREADERGSLRKVGQVFEDLVERLGVLGAVRGVVGLLFKDV